MTEKKNEFFSLWYKNSLITQRIRKRIVEKIPLASSIWHLPNDDVLFSYFSDSSTLINNIFLTLAIEMKIFRDKINLFIPFFRLKLIFSVFIFFCSQSKSIPLWVPQWVWNMKKKISFITWSKWLWFFCNENILHTIRQWKITFWTEKNVLKKNRRDPEWNSFHSGEGKNW